ncbi:MAG: hypothetical protein WAJ94_02420 [Candidatus Cybelea sp.]
MRDLLFAALTLALAACSALPQSAPQAGRLSPAAKSQTLIWAADVYQVNAYTLEGVAVTQLKGFFDAVAVCTDSVGDLYIADDSRQVIFEYAPGGSLPINVFDDAGQEPASCAVSPLSGNLAVANGSNVVVYPASQSAMPVAFTTPEIASYACVGYDASGNLYVDGYGADKSFQLATLRAGGSSLASTRVASLNNRKHGAGGLAWDGEYLVVADPITYELYRIALQGRSGTVAHAARIRGWHDRFAVQFALWGKKLLFPLNNKLLIFAYPPRGRAKGGFSARLNHVIALSVSS